MAPIICISVIVSLNMTNARNIVKRVIMASSIHVDKYLEWQDNALISVNRDPIPDSPYGAHKLFMEKLGLWYAKEGLEVIAIRFGGVNRMDDVGFKDAAPITGLSPPDCVYLIDSCLKSESVPGNFVVIYGVSNNMRRIHDYSNPFGWKPKTDASEFYK